MSVFVISDLHLSTNVSTNKSMEKFGDRWKNYTQKIRKNWNAVVSENDTVVIPGDISWASNLIEAESDLSYINLLNGKKLLGKGNHDYWWTTSKKMNDFFAEKGFSTMSLLYNNAYIVDRYVICGTRGWFPDEYRQIATENTDCKKIINREAIRLKISLDCAVKLQSQHFDRTGVRPDILVFLHFPVVLGDFAITEFLDVLKSYNIEKCFYGHIHNNYSLPRIINYDNISFILTSSDFLNFYPLKI